MARPPLPLGSWGKITRTQIAPGRWRARARYRDYDGRTRQVERYAASGAKAERALTAALTQRATHSSSTITRDTRMSDLSSRWLDEYRAESRSENTVKTYESAVRQIDKALGDLRVHEAGAGAIDSYLQSRPSASAAKTAKVCLTGMLALAARHGAISHNPVREAKARRDEKREVRPLTADEIKDLRSHVAAWVTAGARPRGEDLPMMVDVMLGTGLRIGEVLALRRSDIDLEQGTLMVSGTVVGGRRQPWPKSRKPRELRLPRFALDAVRRQLDRDLPTDQDLLFPGRHGGPRSVNNMQTQWRSAREGGFEWVTPHVFRRTVGTAIAHEVDIESAAAQLGNSVPVARRHYVAERGEGPDARKLLDRRLGPLSVVGG